MSDVSQQLEILGLDESLRLAAAEGRTASVRSRLTNRIETVHDLLSAVPTIGDLSFLHSGLAQTCLPHSRPDSNHQYWKRQSGRFTLIVVPGVISDTKQNSKKLKPPSGDDSMSGYVGVPYGPKARLIMIHLQTEGLKSRTVSLGSSLSAFLRSLGLSISGGPRGSVTAVREQCMRIARCSFSLEWSNISESGHEKTIISDTKIVEGLELLNSSRDDWSGTVELSEKFHSHLKEHAVPLDKRGIAILAGNSLGLDLYALFAYRLPRLTTDVHLRWEHLQSQLGSESPTARIAQNIRQVMPHVLTAYPHANIEVTRTGITLKPSQPAVPRTMVQGFKLLEANL
jgi:hypothetical protein